MKRLIRAFLLLLSLLSTCLGPNWVLAADTWTAQINDKPVKSIENGVVQVLVRVTYSTSTDKIVKEYKLSGASIDIQIQNIAKAQIQQLTDVDSALAGLTTGPINIPADPAAIPGLSAFLDALRAYNSTKHAVDVGIYQVGGPEITDAAAALKMAFKPEFLSFL